MLEISGPNAEQIKYWNEKAGSKWVSLQPMIDAQIGDLGRLAMDRANIVAGEDVLDVGCGCGSATVELASRVTAAGSVLGVDISSVMLAQARKVAQRAGHRHVRFENADAQTHLLSPAAFDLVYSRFGVMFFVDPATAFANLRRSLCTSGRLAFVCWRSLQDNPWMHIPLAAAAQHVTLPAPAGPDAPSPFAFANHDRMRRILAGAGFANVVIEKVDRPLLVGGSSNFDEAVECALQLGPTGALLREADPALRDVVAGAVREALAPYRTAQGVRLPSSAWIVTAQAG